MRIQGEVGTVISFGKSLGDGKNNEPEVKPLVVPPVPEWYIGPSQLIPLCAKLESNVYNSICFPQNMQFHQILGGETNIGVMSPKYMSKCSHWKHPRKQHKIYHKCNGIF